MKKILYGVATCSLVAGCVGVGGLSGDDGTTEVAKQDLDVRAVKNLTRMQGSETSTDEQVRESDTLDPTHSHVTYYSSEFDTKDGPGGTPQAIQVALSTLTQFQQRYGLSTSSVPNPGEATATYYNRGDLGLGREMHCIDNSFDCVTHTCDPAKPEVACYVKNFAAGGPTLDTLGNLTLSEFTFGESADIAFQNINNQTVNNQTAFATVAMVYRPAVTISTGFDTVFFVVYDAAGKLLSAATLDRAGVAYENVFKQPPSTARTAALALLGTPGVNFNNHIPSNCVTCHGGQPYNHNGNGNEAGSLFLPFDLDNFDFDATHTRLSQEPAFAKLNQIVRNVATHAQFLSGSFTAVNSDVNNSIRDQIDGWYGNSGHAALLPTCAAGVACFNSNYVPPGWDFAQNSASNPVTPGANALYKSVIRGSCRNCHEANNHNTALHFDTEVGFNTFVRDPTASANLVAADLANYTMPHSLQSTRQFWLSPEPAVLEAYYRGIGQTAAADTLHSGNAGNVATLDPPAISAMNLGD
jgi:mono/diheme cytochrome c family protein